MNIKVIPDQEMYDTYKRTGAIENCFTFKVGKPFGEGIRLSRKQVKQLIKELKKWLKKGY